MKKYLILIVFAAFGFNSFLWSQDADVLEFVVGKDCDYYPELFLKNAEGIFAARPQIPKDKDEFETTEEFNQRVKNYQAEFKKYASTLKTITIKNVKIYSKVSAFEFDPDNNIVSISGVIQGFYGQWGGFWGIYSLIDGYNAKPDLWISGFKMSSRYDDTRYNGRTNYVFDFSFELDRENAKLLKAQIDNKEPSPYSLTIKVQPKLILTTEGYPRIIFNVEDFWLVKDGQNLVKFNPKNLPVKRLTDQQVWNILENYRPN